MNRPTVALSLGVLFVIGCGPDPRDYTVILRNDSAGPVTAVLTKDGPPMEKEWLPPEDIGAMRHAPADVRVNGIVVKPGQVVDQTRHGEFEAGTNAVLRVYTGEQNLESMLGISPLSPLRADIPLAPGKNVITVDAHGQATRQ